MGDLTVFFEQVNSLYKKKKKKEQTYVQNILECKCCIRSSIAHGRKAIKSFVYKVLKMNRFYANSFEIQS